MKTVLAVVSGVILAVVALAFFGASKRRDQERARRMHTAQSALIASSAIVAANAHAEDSQLAYTLAEAEAERDLRAFEAEALLPSEKKFALSLSMELTNAGMCRMFMVGTSIETRLANQSCVERSQEIRAANAKDIQALQQGLPLPR